MAVFGGSLGARRINGAITGLAARWADRTDRTIYHVVGRRDWEDLGAPDDPARGDGGAAAGLCLVRVPYEDRMDLLYTAADVVVCRAGAMTVAELAAVGVPSILVPLPGAPGDHQTANARVLERAGAAVLVRDGDCDAATLAVTLDTMLADPAGLDAMGRSARSLARRDAAAAGARLVESNAGGRAGTVAR